MNCPKCSAAAAETARFCPRCHATLRYVCPACSYEQRHGGTCEKCGVDFLKFLSAVVASKKIEADRARDRTQQRTGLVKGLLWLPFDMGISLLRNLFRGSRSGGSL